MDEDQSEQFHGNEAISAVADDGFIGEDDDDYEDLYNDVNIGEGFLQSVGKNEELEFIDEEQKKSHTEEPLVEESVPRVADETGGVPDRESGFDEGDSGVGFGGSEPGVKGLGGRVPGPLVGVIKVELGQNSGNMGEFGGEGVNNNVSIEEFRLTGVGSEGIGRQGVLGGVNGFGGAVPGGDGGMDMGMGSRVSPITPPCGGFTGAGGVGSGGAGTMLFVGDLHWWTTDAEVEAELCKYGAVKEVRFFDEKASGKSKGYCQVEFFDPDGATACKEGMNGRVFNGRPCVVAYASPYSVKRMGEAQLNRNQQMGQTALTQSRRGPGEVGRNGGSNAAGSGNYQGGDNRGFGRGGWGRGNMPMGNRGSVGGMRNRAGGMGGRGIMGNGGMGSNPPLLHPQSMMGQGFDGGFGGPMGRMGNYGGFPGGPTPPFSGILSSYPPVGGVGFPGVAPHVNPAFFGRGMPMNGMGMPSSSVDGHNMGMWSDPSMGGWGGDEPGARAGESSYGEDAVSEHQYGEASHERVGWKKERDRGSERDWSASSDKRYRDDRESVYDKDIPIEREPTHDRDWQERRHRDNWSHDIDRDRDREKERERSRDRDRECDRDRNRERDRHREDRDKYADHHKYRDREPAHEDERGRSSRTHSRSRLSQEEEQRSRSRDAEYGKRRRLSSDN